MVRALPTPIACFVDDAMLCDIRARILLAIHCSIRSLFMILGFPEEKLRELAISLDKFNDRPLSWLREQLGFLICSRTMSVTLPPEKRQSLLSEFGHWHEDRQSFSAKQAAR